MFYWLDNFFGVCV